MIKNTKKLVGAALVGMLFAGQAAAVVMDNAGNLNTAGAYDRIQTVVPGAFEHDYAFSLSLTSSVGNALTNFVLTTQNAPGVTTMVRNIAGIGLAFFSAGGGQIGGSFAAGTGSLNLGLGNYFARITGNANGSNGGRYLFSLEASPTVAAPVPEPAEWMMMVAGLIVMGFIARRRKNIV